MTSFASILVGTDLSIDDRNAVRRAALLARQSGARLHILHVLDASRWPWSPPAELHLESVAARDALRRLAVEIAGAHDVAATVEVRVGDPLQALAQASRSADIVVLGRRGRRRLASAFGRTADRLLRLGRCPVLVVKRAADAPYRRALTPTDFTAGAAAALRMAARLVVGGSLHVFHAHDASLASMLRRADVAEPAIRQVRAREEAGLLARLRSTVTRLGLDRQTISISVGRGPADLATLEVAQAFGADLIITGQSPRSVLRTFFLRSISRSVQAASTCDVLVVPPTPDRPSAPTGSVRPHGTTKAPAHWMSHTPGVLPPKVS